MKVAEQNYLRERIYEMLGRHSKSVVVKHFLKENVVRSTIYGIVQHYESRKASVGSRKTSHPLKLDKVKLQKLKKVVVNQIGASNRKLGRKFGISKETVRQNLIKVGAKFHKGVTVLRCSEKQLEEIPRKCRILCQKYLEDNVEIILGDEKYFSFA